MPDPPAMARREDSGLLLPTPEPAEMYHYSQLGRRRLEVPSATFRHRRFLPTVVLAVACAPSTGGHRTNVRFLSLKSPRLFIDYMAYRYLVLTLLVDWRLSSRHRHSTGGELSAKWSSVPLAPIALRKDPYARRSALATFVSAISSVLCDVAMFIRIWP